MPEPRRDLHATPGVAQLRAALRSPRTAAVVALSFASGLPLGLVWYAIPDWLRDAGVDIRVVGLVTLAQAPWAFKVAWAPLLDRFAPPFWGRRRGWMAVTLLALAACALLLAGVGEHPDSVWVVGALALATATASASYDIACDAYAVDVLEPAEQGAAAGARSAMYRAAMAVSGGLTISLASRWGWPAVNALLALVYLLMLPLTWRAPEPRQVVSPPTTLRAAVWEPFVSFLSRPRAFEILAFVVLYKLADQLAQSLTRPFLIDMGYSADHRALATATVGLAATMVGGLLGGWVTTIAGLGTSLWIFGVLQLSSNAGFFLLARSTAPNLPLMYAATSFELLTSGLGTGAFSVLLLRLTARRFSATQYALLSSLFALPRIAAGPITGFTVHAIGWPAFYLATMVVGIPGLVMLARFAPPGVREPGLDEDVDAGPARAEPALSAPALIARGVAGGALIGAAGFVALTALALAGAAGSSDSTGWREALRSLAFPVALEGWLQLAALAVTAVLGGLATAAAIAARTARERKPR